MLRSRGAKEVEGRRGKGRGSRFFDEESERERRKGGATVCEYESEEWEKEEREEAEVRKRFSANEKHAISLCRFKAFPSMNRIRSSILLSKVKLADLSER